MTRLRALFDAGALVDDDPADSETPLMPPPATAIRRWLGCSSRPVPELDAAASVPAGAVPVALLCGTRPCSACPDVVEVLMAAGATDLVQAAAAGDTPGR